jgi:hypothetical protein
MYLSKEFRRSSICFGSAQYCSSGGRSNGFIYNYIFGSNIGRGRHLLGDFGIWYLIWYYVFVVNFESSSDHINKFSAPELARGLEFPEYCCRFRIPVGFFDSFCTRNNIREPLPRLLVKGLGQPKNARVVEFRWEPHIIRIQRAFLDWAKKGLMWFFVSNS